MSYSETHLEMSTSSAWSIHCTEFPGKLLRERVRRHIQFDRCCSAYGEIVLVKNQRGVAVMVWDIDIYLDEHSSTKTQKKFTAHILTGFN